MEAIYIFKFSDSDYKYKRSSLTNGELQPGTLEGKVIGGKYRIIRKMRNIGNCTLYYAAYGMPQRICVVQASEVKDNKLPCRLVATRKAYADNIIRVYEVWQENNITYVVKERFGTYWLYAQLMAE